MNNGTQFSANSVLDWYMEAELMLADFLNYVPYCDAHEEVWSPKLVIVLQETCSQLDSLWRWEATNVHGRNGKVDITHYFELYGPDMAPRWVVFWADEPRKVEPFGEWKKVNEFSKEKCSEYPVDWWKEGYQKIKHNRLENRNCATLKRVVEGVAGLFLAIVRSEACWECLWEKHWMSWDDSRGMPFNPLECLAEDYKRGGRTGCCNSARMAIESKLFTYPVGLCAGLIKADKSFPVWEGNCSRRFKAWYHGLCNRDGA